MNPNTQRGGANVAQAGRPRKPISKKTFEELCRIQCTEEEICDVLDVSRQSLNRWARETYGANFGQVYKKYREGGKASLRRSQWALAKTNATMAIWLGKQMLNQSDSPVEVNARVSNNLIEALKSTASADWAGDQDDAKTEEDAPDRV